MGDSRLRLVGAIALAWIGGCAEESPPVCTERDPAVAMPASLAACETEECSRTGGFYWQDPTGTLGPRPFAMSCIVREERPVDAGLRGWVLSACSGQRTSSSGALEVRFDSGAGPLLVPDQRVTVHVLLHSDHDPHRTGYAWSILDEDGVLLAAHTFGGGLSQDILGTSSLRTVAQACVREGLCQSEVTPLSVEFEHDGVVTTIPQGRRERVDGEPAFDIAVPQAEQVTGASCGIFPDSTNVRLTIFRVGVGDE